MWKDGLQHYFLKVGCVFGNGKYDKGYGFMGFQNPFTQDNLINFEKLINRSEPFNFCEYTEWKEVLQIKDKLLSCKNVILVQAYDENINYPLMTFTREHTYFN